MKTLAVSFSNVGNLNSKVTDFYLNFVSFFMYSTAMIINPPRIVVVVVDKLIEQ